MKFFWPQSRGDCSPRPRWRGSWYRRSGSKNRIGATGSTNNVDDIFSPVDTMQQRNRRTDGRTDTGRQQRPRLRRDKVTIELQYEIIPILSNGTTFNDLEWPLTRISRSRHFSTFIISETTRDRATVTIERQYARYRMVTFPMTLTDPQPGFEGRSVFEVEYLKNGVP